MEESIEEIWRSVPCAPAYEVSHLGRVRRNGRILKTRVDTNGYEKVSLSLGKKHSYRHTQVHRIVCEAFYGLPGVGMQAGHRNGNRLDNRAANLRWITPSQNTREKFAHGYKPPHGSRHHAAKITEADVVHIRHLRGMGEPVKEVAALYSISRATVSEIANRKLWSHVA